MNGHVQMHLSRAPTPSTFNSEKAEDRVSIFCVQPLYNHFLVTNLFLYEQFSEGIMGWKNYRIMGRIMCLSLCRIHPDQLSNDIISGDNDAVSSCNTYVYHSLLHIQWSIYRVKFA